MRQRKTIDTWQIWIDYGHGWEHECTEMTFKEARERSKEYHANCRCQVSIRFKRERIEQTESAQSKEVVVTA